MQTRSEPVNKICYQQLINYKFRANWVDRSWPAEDRDTPLAAYGIDQAKQLAEYVKLYQPSSIYSSPFQRCLQTAQPTSEALQLPIKVEPGEWFHENPPNKLPTLHPQPYHSNLRAKFSDIDASYHPVFFPNRHGESLDDLHERCKIAITNLIRREEIRGVSGAIVIFTHAASAIALGRGLLSDRTREIRAGCASCSELFDVHLQYARDGNDWKLAQNGYSGHLAQGEERHWDFSLSSREYEDGEAGTENADQGVWGLMPEARL
ncbi:hypothetical protein E3P99_03592 [Wallemia hederae]|uniref:Phosphoglycerate mutase-like protein n=1 Tax=Wallemia hederae TaxID=1540922 RepID=A0A4T0FJ31_9BASI|nr:hypothetical protein E3P99_03592 [Wallemia hederae]